MPEVDEFDIVGRLEQILDAPEPVDTETPDTTPTITTEIQPQAAPEAEQTTEGVNASEVASAPVVDTPAPVVPEAPKPQPDSSKELEQRLSEVAQTKQEAIAARDQYLNRLNAIVPQLEAGIQGEFADLKAPEDVYRLMQTDPNRYNSFVIAQTRLNQARTAQAQASQEAQQSYISQEQKNLNKAIPELADTEKAPALVAELRAYAKSVGIPDNRQARSADEVIRLHREMTLAKELSAFKSEKAAQAKALEEANKKAAKAPQVQTPGVQRETNKDEKASSDLSRFQKSGHLNDLQALLTHIL